jgi:hypothetical protein
VIRPREYTTREILGRLPAEQRAQFLALDPAERRLLLNGTAQEKEEYAARPADAAARYAKLAPADREAEAKEGWRARCVERRHVRPAPVAPREPAIAPRPDAPPAPTLVQRLLGYGGVIRG